MKYVGNGDFNDLVSFATERKGSYCEYKFSKDLHDFLLTLTKTFSFDKRLNQREYWKDIDSENVLWRIILK